MPDAVKNIKRNRCVLGIFVFFMVFGTHAQPLHPVRCVVIDPGHGGKDPGCNGLFAKEKDVCLAVGLKLKRYIEKYMPDVRVIMTREKDEFVELEERAQIANRNKADLFISIHCNAAGKPVMVRDPKTRKMRIKMRRNSRGKWVPVETINPEPFGTETYVMGIKNEEGKMQVAMRENAAIYLEDNYEKKYEGFDPDSEESYIIMSNFTSALVIKSAILAAKMQEDFRNFAGRIDKGVHRQSIWVLWRTSMPSVLTELGYLTNPAEEKFLASEIGQDYLAKCITRSIRRYKAEMEAKKYAYEDELENLHPLENENLLVIKNHPSECVDSMGEKTESKDEIRKLPDSASLVVYTDAKKNDGKNKKNSDIFPTSGSDTLMAGSQADCDTFAMVIPVYRVQFASTSKPINLLELSGKGLLCPYYYIHDNRYKYVSGSFVRLRDAVAHQKLLQWNGFKDSFVIAWHRGKRISITEANQFHKYTDN